MSNSSDGSKFAAGYSKNFPAICLNESNHHEWLRLCTTLSVTSDELFLLLITAYNSHKSESSVLGDEENRLASHKDRIYSKLIQQRMNNSRECDLHYYESTENGTKYSSAHTSLLKSFFGEQFMLELSELYNEYQRGSFCSKARSEIVLSVPPGFDNMVQFCYTGDYHLPGESSLNTAAIRSWIERIVEEGEFKTLMINNLDKLEKTDTALSQQKSTDVNDFLMKLPDENCNIENDQLTLNQNDEDSSQIILDKDNLGIGKDIGTNKEPIFEPDSSNDTSESDCLSEFDNFADKEEISIEISTSQNDESSDCQPSSSHVRCDECGDRFPTRAQLGKHLRDEHFKNFPKRRSSRTLPKKKAYFSIENNLKPKKDVAAKVEISIGECCNEEFYNKLKLGYHIFREHSIAFANCSECQELILLEELVNHYQVRHNYGAYPKDESHEAPNTPVQPGSETVNAILDSGNSLQGIDSNLQQMIPGSIPVPGSEPMCSFDEANLTENGQPHPLVENKAVNFWLKEVTCVGCNKRMNVVKYVEHLHEQLDLAKNTLHSKSVNLHKFHRCLLFQCQLCHGSRVAPEKAMRLYLMLTKHIRRYHEIGSMGDEKVPCDICGNLVVQFYLKSHQRTHLPEHKKSSLLTQKVTCDICGKEIIKKRITVHRRTHFEKFSCPHCAKVFNRKENMRVHERIHTGEKPYVCDICGKGFRQHVELRLHNRKHDKEKAQMLQTQEQDKYLNQTIFYVQGNLVG